MITGMTDDYHLLRVQKRTAMCSDPGYLHNINKCSLIITCIIT